jgi:flagellar protein FlaG
MDISSIQSSSSAVSAKAERSQGGASSITVVSAVEQKSVQGTAADKAAGSVPASEASREDVEAAVATIQDFVQTVRRDLNFSLEENSGRVVVKVTDSGSGDVIRQIPSEEALQLAENLSEVRSLLFKAEA